MLDIVIDSFKDKYVGKIVKSIELSPTDITIYFSDGDLIRVESMEQNKEILAFTFR